MPSDKFSLTTRSPNLDAIDYSNNASLVATEGSITSNASLPILSVENTNVSIKTIYTFEFLLVNPV